MYGDYIITLSGKDIKNTHDVFDMLDKYAEETYGTYRNYGITWREDHCVAHFAFNNEYDSKQFKKYITNIVGK